MKTKKMMVSISSVIEVPSNCKLVSQTETEVAFFMIGGKRYTIDLKMMEWNLVGVSGTWVGEEKHVMLEDMTKKTSYQISLGGKRVNLTVVESERNRKRRVQNDA